MCLAGIFQCRSGVAASKQPASFKPLRSQGQNPDKAIPFTLSSYLELVDWTGRVVRKDKRGSISVDTPPILERLRIDPDEWLKTICWNNRFHRAVGKLASLKAYAAQIGTQWVYRVSCSQSLLSAIIRFHFIITENQAIHILGGQGDLAVFFLFFLSCSKFNLFTYRMTAWFSLCWSVFQNKVWIRSFLGRLFSLIYGCLTLFIFLSDLELILMSG